MKISARNQLKGTVSAIKDGAVNGIVSLDLGEAAITADITMESIKELGLAEGKDAIAIIKASNVMFAAGSEPIKGISARNQLAGLINGFARRIAVSINDMPSSIARAVNQVAEQKPAA